MPLRELMGCDGGAVLVEFTDSRTVFTDSGLETIASTGYRDWSDAVGTV